MAANGSRANSQRHGAQPGNNNLARGKKFNRECVTWLRGSGYPHAEVTPSHHRGDINGVGDLNVECKAERDWRNLAAHVRQSECDAEARDLPDAVVWAKRVGKGPAGGYMIMSPHTFWSMRCELDRLQAVELEYAHWRQSLAAAAQVREATG